VTTPAPTAPNAQQAVERLLTADGVQPSWFTDGMLEAVPLSKLDPIIRQLTSSLGALQRIESTDKPHRFVAVFDGGTLRVAASVDSQGRFEGLLFKPGSSSASFDELKAELAKLPGRVGAIIITDGADKLALAADEPLAVGSAFKLAVLAAVREHSAAKNKWSKVVELPEQAKSLPSGMLHNWPTTSPLTVQTLASLMISISDNTATDALIQLVGREAVEKHAPRNKPLLTTADMFRLKAPGGEAFLERYRKGDRAARRALLGELAAVPLPSISTYPKEPTALDVEWFFSARELCTLMQQVKDLDLMTINAGIASKTDWQRVAFKGGSEPGVLNFTTWVEKDGHESCVSVSWNADEKLDENKLAILYSRLLAAAGR